MNSHDASLKHSAVGHAPAHAHVSRRRRIARRISGFVLDYLVAMPAGCVIALLWANTLPDSYYRFAHAMTFPVNEVGIVFFFALITKEVTEATLPGGALHPWRRAALPVAAAVGSVIVSIGCYLAFLQNVGEPMLMSGWVAACAIDIPGSYIIARVIFGRHPAVPFLLLLAISADAIGLACVAVLQPIGNAQPFVGLGLMACALALAAFLRRRHAKNFWLYLAGPGTMSWWALFLAGVHPALALVPIVPFFPHAKRDPGLFVESPPQIHDTLTLFERWWRLPVEAVLFLFGLVNAGVPIHGLELGAWAIPVAALGRPVGIVLAAGLALAAGLHLPQRVGWRELLVVACTACIGLIFALFFATAVMPLGPLLLEMKMGALLTIGGGALAFAAARLLRVGRFGRASKSV